MLRRDHHHLVAAVYAYREGLKGYDVSELPLRDWDSQIGTQLRRESVLSFLSHVALYVLLIIPFFELPLWCYGKCINHEDQYWELDFSFVVDMVCLVVVLLWTHVQLTLFCGNTKRTRKVLASMHKKRPKADGLGGEVIPYRLITIFSRFVVLLITIIDEVTTFYWRYKTIRVLPFARAMLFVLACPVRMQHVVDSAKSLYEVRSMIYLLLLWMLLYGWLGCLLWNGTAEGNDYFPTPVEGFITMYHLLNFYNFPDVMVAALKKSRTTGTLFFVSYVIVGPLLIVYIIWGMLYNVNRNFMTIARDRWTRSFTRSSSVSFQCLLLWEATNIHSKVEEAKIDFSTVKSFLMQVTHLSDTSAESVLNSMHRKDLKSFVRNEFLTLCELLEHQNQVEFYTMDPHPVLPSLLPLVEHPWRNRVGDVVVVLSLSVTMYETYMIVVFKHTLMDCLMAEVSEWCIASYFAVEVLCRILALGGTYYFSGVSNCIDFVTAVVPPLCTPLVGPTTILSVRLLRMSKWITEVPKLEIYFVTAARSAYALYNLFPPLLLLTYLYAAWGIYWFGGRLTPYNALLEKTEYDDFDYYVFNFNDWGGALVVLFGLINVTMLEVMDAAVVVTGSYMARLYFITYQLILFFTVVGVTISYVIDTFLLTFETIELEDNNAIIPRLSSNVLANALNPYEKANLGYGECDTTLNTSFDGGVPGGYGAISRTQSIVSADQWRPAAMIPPADSLLNRLFTALYGKI